jgi:hypothetical protein
MSPLKILLTSVLCAASASVFAQTTVEGIDACMKIKWSAQFLKEHPRAPAGCQEVDTRNGVKYAKFSGTVKSISATQATVAMKNVAGTELGSIMVDTGSGAMVKINGKDTKAADLKVGDNLNFYVKEGDFGASPTMSSDAAMMKPVTPKAMPAN